MNFPGGSDGKESACNAGNLGYVPKNRVSKHMRQALIELHG